MRVIDPGHVYDLDYLDNSNPLLTGRLSFVKRAGPKFPGNIGSHPGTTIQEVCRALIDRFRYLHNQIPCWINPVCVLLLRVVINLLEYRAAKRHGRTHHFTLKIENLATDPKDLHIK